MEAAQRWARAYREELEACGKSEDELLDELTRIEATMRSLAFRLIENYLDLNRPGTQGRS